ncbi:pirin family protein [Enhydrobacter sp.]|jgi:redox-sensitive bicupin YhaK (pirin superfamily)|uniref:pirin family protein n=1 Tax=Enhydrobacter sp. TaxID=1894999 RepID=UPI002638403C|nr:pirin family protein [Enhydrobacter sp.]WIM14403.1 MAG: Pirin [Enhydrobacter sp.]
MADPIELLIQGRAHELTPGFPVRRVLPSTKRRTVGPFIFLDHFGPLDVPPGGDGMEVRPHPHIGLATVTYLFEGGIFHRDSLGHAQAIRPGDVNWMTAGSGIAHSERTEPGMRQSGFRMHGIQTWVALPKAHEETAPSFEHVPVSRLPAWQDGKAALRLIVGSYAGRTAPTAHFSPIFYVAAEVPAAAALAVTPEHAERAVYVAAGTAMIGDRQLGVGDLAILAAGRATDAIAGMDGARLMLLGGTALDGPRHIWWNFVSSSKERIERAKADWKDGRFARVPGDPEFIPLPER